MPKKYTTMLTLAMTLVAASCTSGPSNNGPICDGTATARTEHAAALAADGGDLSVTTGARLIKLMDAGCGD